MIATVSLRLLYLIFSQLLSWLTLLPRTPSSKDIELLDLVGFQNLATWLDLLF